jgi:hypothetical protein
MQSPFEENIQQNDNGGLAIPSDHFKTIFTR